MVLMVPYYFYIHVMYLLTYLDIFIESTTEFILASLDSAEQLVKECQVTKSVTYHQTVKT